MYVHALWEQLSGPETLINGVSFFQLYIWHICWSMASSSKWDTCIILISLVKNHMTSSLTDGLPQYCDVCIWLAAVTWANQGLVTNMLSQPQPTLLSLLMEWKYTSELRYWHGLNMLIVDKTRNWSIIKGIFIHALQEQVSRPHALANRL